MNCIVCAKEVLPQYKKAIKRWGERKYCSKRCTKLAYEEKYPERVAIAKQKWVENNPEKRAEASNNYRLRNPEFYRQYSSLRTRYMLQAKPAWVDEAKLLEFYKLAVELGLEVDHIIPIKHNKVCGLHVPWNLQLLTRAENARKSNKFDDDLLGVIK